MADLSSKIRDAQTAADLEMTAYLSQMSDSDRGTYAGKNVAVALDRVKASKSDRFKYLSEDLTGADNNLTSTAYYITRTQNLTDMALDIDKVAQGQVATSDINAGIIARQQEINEWANSNKLDTLFFLQILFVALTFISSMVFLNSVNLISSYLLNLLIVLSGAFAVFVLITRARYTSVMRDSRYWSKQRFGRQTGPNIKTDKCGGTPAPPVPAPAPKKKACPADLSGLPGDNADLPVGWGGSA